MGGESAARVPGELLRELQARLDEPDRVHDRMRDERGARRAQHVHQRAGGRAVRVRQHALQLRVHPEVDCAARNTRTPTVTHLRATSNVSQTTNWE